VALADLSVSCARCTPQTKENQNKILIMNTNEQYGEFTGPTEVRIVRTLPGPIEHVWAFLTEPEKRARWFCGGVLEQKVGGRVEFAMVHKNLGPNETPPAKYAEVHDPGVTFEGRVLRCDAPRLLAYTFGDDNSEVTYELTPKGKQVVLALTHRVRGAAEEAQLADYAAGWHLHLTHLVALMEGAPRPPFWPLEAKLRPAYEELRASEVKR
jgi:uncharacterized protein YndB with AHSA1/START domain